MGNSVQHLVLGGRRLELRFSTAAERALAANGAPFAVEMELYFSCLIRKRVRILPEPHPGATCVRFNDQITVCFRPVMTRVCAVDSVEGKPELEPFPIRRPEAFLPKWLTLDWHAGNWSGEFGY
jgi:hypothetical protein